MRILEIIEKIFPSININFMLRRTRARVWKQNCHYTELNQRPIGAAVTNTDALPVMSMEPATPSLPG